VSETISPTGSSKLIMENLAISRQGEVDRRDRTDNRNNYEKHKVCFSELPWWGRANVPHHGLYTNLPPKSLDVFKFLSYLN